MTIESIRAVRNATFAEKSLSLPPSSRAEVQPSGTKRDGEGTSKMSETVGEVGLTNFNPIGTSRERKGNVVEAICKLILMSRLQSPHRARRGIPFASAFFLLAFFALRASSVLRRGEEAARASANFCPRVVPRALHPAKYPLRVVTVPESTLSVSLARSLARPALLVTSLRHRRRCFSIINHVSGFSRYARLRLR